MFCHRQTMVPAGENGVLMLSPPSRLLATFRSTESTENNFRNNCEIVLGAFGAGPSQNSQNDDPSIPIRDRREGPFLQGQQPPTNRGTESANGANQLLRRWSGVLRPRKPPQKVHTEHRATESSIDSVATFTGDRNSRVRGRTQGHWLARPTAHMSDEPEP